MVLDKETRQLFLGTVLEYQRCFTLLAAYDTELRRIFGQEWTNSFKKQAETLIQHPAAKEASSQHFAHLFDVVFQGLNKDSAQELLDLAEAHNPQKWS